MCDNDCVNRSEKNEKGDRVYSEGSFDNTIPVFGCPHITGAFYDAADLEVGFQKCKANILACVTK